MDPLRPTPAIRSTPPGTRPVAATHTRLAEQLRQAAEAACAHSEEVMESVLRRRSSQPKPTRETVERIERTAMRLEMARSRREMRDADLETVRRMRLEEREAVELERWIRSQAASMLADGWTPGELADIGIDARYTADPPPPEGGARQ